MSVSPRDLEQVPPAELEAERALVAGVLEAGQGVEAGVDDGQSVRYAIESAGALPRETWSSGAHWRLWSTCLELHATRGAVSPTLVKHALRQQPGDWAADLALVDELAAERASFAHQRHYADLLREAAAKRAVFYLGRRLTAESLNGSTAAELRAMATEGLAQVDGAGAAGAPAEWRTAREIVESSEAEVQFSVEGLVMPGCLTLIAADSGAGKSTFTGGLVRGALEGSNVAGLKCAKAPAVVWVSEESSRTFRLALRPWGLTHDNLHILGREAHAGRDWAWMIEAADRKAAKTGASIVIVDTYSGLNGFPDDAESKPGPHVAALRPLKALAAKGPAVLILHHVVKDASRRGVNRIAGSRHLAAEMDAVIEMNVDGPQGSAVRSLHATKGRGPGWVNGFRFELRIHGDGTDRWFEAERVNASGREAALDTKILRLVRANPGQSMHQVEEAMGGKATTVRRAVGRLVEAGKLEEKTGPRNARLIHPAPVRPSDSDELSEVGSGDLVPAPMGGRGGRGQPPEPATTSSHLVPAEGTRSTDGGAPDA